MQIIVSGMTGGLALWLQMPGGANLLTLAPLVFIFAIFYFLLIMPQQRKQKKWQLMLSELKNGDKIVTSGGLRGTIISLKDDALVLRVPPLRSRPRLMRLVIAASRPVPDHSCGTPKMPNKKTSRIPTMTTNFQVRFLFMKNQSIVLIQPCQRSVAPP